MKTGSSQGDGGPFTVKPIHEAGAEILRDVCESIQVGLLLLNPRSAAEAPWANRFFQALPRRQQEKILGHIRQRLRDNPSLESEKARNEELEVHDGKGRFVYGFTIYPVLPDAVMVFISEIAAKSISRESRQRNLFFDRLSEMVAEIAHEIGNPLTGIHTMLQVLRLNITVWNREKIDDYIQRSISEINRLNGFLNRIRDISGETLLHVHSLGLRDLIMRVYTHNRERFSHQGVRFECNVDPGIRVRVDGDAFHQILLNLMNNSLNFLKFGQWVKLFLEGVDEHYVSLVYANNGPPIPEEDRERIFFPFYTTREQGEGIGLAVSLKLITRMGGAMKAESPPEGVGVRFLIHLPRGGP